MKKFYDLMKKVPLLAGIVGVVLGIVSIKIVGHGYAQIGKEGMMIRIVMTCVSLLFLYLISGPKIFENSSNETGYALKKLLPFIIYAAIAGVVSFVAALSAKPLRSDWPVVLIIGAVEMLFVGLYEEISYRALINDAFLYQFRDKKGIFAVIAVVSCLVFGYIHVMSVDISTPLAFAQAAMKIINCALYGFSFLVIYWKTHNIWAGAVAHGIYDLCTAVVSNLFEDGGSNGYVMEGTIESEGTVLNMGAMALAYYLFEFVFMIILTIVMIRVLKTIDFEKIRKEW